MDMNYSSPDHKAILADSILEITDLAKVIEELKKQISLMQEDIEVMNRSLNEFGQQIEYVKAKSAEYLTATAIQAFDDQLKKVEMMIGRLLKEK